MCTVGYWKQGTSTAWPWFNLFCTSSCQILVPLLRLHVLPWEEGPNYCWALPASYTQKFDKPTITRLSKMPRDYKESYSEGSNYVVSFQTESSIYFLKCRHFPSISSHFGCLSLRVCPQDIYSSKRGGSNLLGIGIKLPCGNHSQLSVRAE